MHHHGYYWQSCVLVGGRDTRSNMRTVIMTSYMRAFGGKKTKNLRINLGSHALQGSTENRHDIATIHTARYAVCLSGKPIKAGTRVDERHTPGSTLQQSTWYVFDRR